MDDFCHHNLQIRFASRHGLRPWKAGSRRHPRHLDDAFNHNLRIKRHQKEITGARSNQFVLQHRIAESGGNHKTWFISKIHFPDRFHHAYGVKPRHKNIHQYNLRTHLSNHLNHGQTIARYDHCLKSVCFEQGCAFRAIFARTLRNQHFCLFFHPFDSPFFAFP